MVVLFSKWTVLVGVVFSMFNVHFMYKPCSKLPFRAKHAKCQLDIAPVQIAHVFILCCTTQINPPQF